jgi:hypothetical protein
MVLPLRYIEQGKNGAMLLLIIARIIKYYSNADIFEPP